jgi:hypothetical protein
MARRKRNREAAEAKTEDEVKTLARIDQLAEAVAERLSDSERARWTGLAVGLGFATLVGLIGMAIYLFFRRGGSATSVAGLGDGQMPLPITIINQLPEGYAAPRKKKLKQLKGENGERKLKVNISDGLTEELAQASPVNRDTTMRNIRLTTNAAIRVMTAVGPNAWRVQVRVLGPPGSFAALATDASRLRVVNSFMGDDVLIVPAGAVQELTINPRQIIYGMGSDNRLSVSVVASEQILSAAPQLSVVR